MGKILFRKTIAIVTITLFILLSFNTSIGSVTIKNTTEEPSTYGDLKVHFIDVGQGDSILIQTPGDKFTLIDTGRRFYANTVIDYLDSLSVNTLEAFIAIHPHEDHIGGSEEIFDAYDILSVYHPGFPYGSQAYQRFLNAAQNEGCPIYTDDEVDPGDYIYIGSSVSCQILHINKDASNANDASVVLRLDYFLISFLFTGDIHGTIGDMVEYDLTDDWNVDIDILKVAHHGSGYSSTNYFLDEATPDVSVICVGDGNTYGHPHTDALYRLSEHNSLILRTDLNGDIIVSTTGYSYDIEYEKPENEPLAPIVRGPTTGATNVEHMFSAKSFDPEGDMVYYMWDWGDGNCTNWIGPFYSGVEVYEYHTWTIQGAFVIKVKAKDIYNHESDWGTLNVIMPRNKMKYKIFFDRLLELFPNAFYFLRTLFKINNTIIIGIFKLNFTISFIRGR